MADPPRRRPRVGLFGGTFNPIHYGHLRVADAVRRRLGLDELRLVPAGEPPHKRADVAVAPAEDRLAMARLAIGEFPGLSVSDIELLRDGPSFTIDTLAAIRRELGHDADLYLIVGADTLHELPTWHRASELSGMAEIVVVNRPGAPIRATDELRRTFGDETARRVVENTVEVPPEPLSSTGIRERVRAGRSIRGCVPEPVARYIESRRLFREKPPDGGEGSP